MGHTALEKLEVGAPGKLSILKVLEKYQTRDKNWGGIASGEVEIDQDRFTIVTVPATHQMRNSQLQFVKRECHDIIFLYLISGNMNMHYHFV